MNQSLGDCGGLVGEEFVKLIRSHDLFIRATIEGYKSDIKNALVGANVRFIVHDAVKEIREKPSHKLKGSQAAAQRQMQRMNARRAMAEKAFGLRD